MWIEGRQHVRGLRKRCLRARVCSHVCGNEKPSRMRRTHVLQGFLRQMSKTSVFVSDAPPSSVRLLSSLQQPCERAMPHTPLTGLACPTVPGACFQVFRSGSCISAAPLPRSPTVSLFGMFTFFQLFFSSFPRLSRSLFIPCRRDRARATIKPARKCRDAPRSNSGTPHTRSFPLSATPS